MPNIPSDSSAPSTVTRAGQTLISFGGCNYLGLAHHQTVHQATINAIPTFGLSTSASRETTGNATPHANLESALREFCNHQSALLVPDGYIANLAAFQGLANLSISHALLDARAHSSLADAAKLANMTLHFYDHRDAAHAATILATLDAPAVLATDAVFTTDGTLAPIADLTKALRPNDTLLLDDCHGFAVLGNQGRGTPNQLNCTHPQLLVTTTLAKGLGCAGGVVMGPAAAVESARTTSTAYICTTPASPPLAAGALAALHILQTDATLYQSLRTNIQLVHQILQSHHIETNSPSITPIFAFTIGDDSTMHTIEQDLLNQGILLPLMRYPNGPAPLYFRLSVTAMHTPSQLDQLDAALTKALACENAS